MDQATLNRHPATLGRTTLLHLPDGLGLDIVSVTDQYWEHQTEHDELANGRVLSIFEYTATWTWWERHPVGDEFVHIIAGKVDFELDDGQDRRTLQLTAGQGAIVPQGVWHRAVLDVPSTLMFVTPTPARTEHRTIT